MPKEMTAIEACNRLGITLDALYRLIYARRLTARKEGRVWRVSSSAVEARLRTRQKPQSGCRLNGGNPAPGQPS